MRARTSCWLAIACLPLAACGSSGTFANRPRPATPIDLTVYVNDHRVLLSPASAGAGPVLFFITNQASRTVSLVVRAPGGRTLADTGPINPQSTAQVTVDTNNSGDYEIATDSAAAAGAQLSIHPIRPATLHIGVPRPNGDNVLLQP